jgi:hypothetical protein
MVSAITSLITGMYARTWIAPWVDDYRLVSPSMPADQWPPLMPDLADIYREIRAAATDGEPNV